MGQLPQNIKKLKVHPAVGIARLSAIPAQGDYYFVFGELPAGGRTYKANDLMKRQAVRFRIFAYGDNNTGIEELTPNRLDALGIDVVWQARLGNRKVARITGVAGEAFTAEGSSDANGGQVVAQLSSFAQGQNIPLGQITPQGLFIPPQAKVIQRNQDTTRSEGLHDPNITDNTSDGFVTVALKDRDTGSVISIPTLEAGVWVTPQDFSPDVFDDEPGLFAPDPDKRTLVQFLVTGLNLQDVAPVNPVNQTARRLDRDALKPATSDFRPGIECHPKQPSSGGGNTQAIQDFASRLYAPSATGDPDEIRLAPKTTAGGGGALPGELTSGLCSPWQFDFIACSCDYWASQRPDLLFKDASATDQVAWLRKKVSDVGQAPAGGSLDSAEQIIAEVDQLGVARKVGGQIVETERTQDLS
jgi:L-Lysine epsilon oxidase N-terminal